MRSFLLVLVLLATGLNVKNLNAFQKEKYTHVHNDDFISSLLETISYDKLVAAKYSISKTSLKNDAGHAISFVNEENRFVCYKSNYNTFTKYFVVTRPDKIIDTLISIGSSKGEVLKKLGVSKSLDVLRVSDLEEGAILTLYFSGGKLFKVNFNATVD